MPQSDYQNTRQQRIAKERAKRIRERSGPDSLEWIQSALFIYAAVQEGLGDDLHKAIWAYTAAMIGRLEDILTEAKYITRAEDIAEEYRWAAKQLRVAIARHLKLMKMFEGQDARVPKVDEAGKHIADMVHSPTDEDIGDALQYMSREFKPKHPEYKAVLPADLDLSY